MLKRGVMIIQVYWNNTPYAQEEAKKSAFD
jgi:adenylyl- and sulfurtransferase ThiI